MAVWQYQFALVPVNGIMAIHGHIPEEISCHKTPEGQDAVCNAECGLYWESRGNPENIESAFRGIVPKTSGDKDPVIRFGNLEENAIEIWKGEGILIKMDLRKPDQKFFDDVLRVAQKQDCMIVPAEKARPILPERIKVLENIRTSRPHSFVKDPIAFFRAFVDKELSEKPNP